MEFENYRTKILLPILFKLEELILKAYEILQRFAIAWELVIAEGDPQFQFEFKNIGVFHRLVMQMLNMTKDYVI